MAIICTVRIPRAHAEVQSVEDGNPELMERIGGAAFRHMTTHRRLIGDGEVIDIDEFPAREDYDAFMSEVGDEVARYGKLLGASDTIYDVLEGGDFDFAQMRGAAS
jgi:hypothetical protein